MKNLFKSFYNHVFFCISIALAIVFTSCHEDIKNKSIPSLSIEKAKQYIEQIVLNSRNRSFKNILQTREDSSETLDNSLILELDWNNASTFYDDSLEKTIVEVPIINSGLSDLIVVSSNSTLDSNQISQYPSKKKVIITEDIYGVLDYAIMKIGGSYEYYLTYGNNDLNGFGSMDENFEGIVTFVDINDTILSIFNFVDQEWQLIDSFWLDESNFNNLSQRWEIICIKWYENVDCPCEGHSTDDYCTCPTKPRRIIHEICFEVPVFGNGNSGYTNNGVVWKWGSTSNNNYNNNSLNNKMNEFNDLCDLNLNATNNTHKAIAKFCLQASNFNYCVLTELAKTGVEEELLDDCWQEFYGVSDEEWDILNDSDLFNIDDQPDEDLNDCEKKLRWLHIDCALSIYFNKLSAKAATLDLFGKNGLNDCSDAFRHAYWNALNTKSCGVVNAKLFADAHEVCNGVMQGPSLEVEMDFHNNDNGRNIAVNNPNATDAELKVLIMNELNQGRLKFIYPRNSDGHINQDSEVISTFQNCD